MGVLASCFAAIVFLMDVSFSVAPQDFENMKKGHADALSQPQIARLVEREGLAVSFVQFWFAQHVSIEWRVLRTRAELENLIQEVRDMPREGGSSTYTGEALQFSVNLLERAPCGDHRIVDIVTDGIGNGRVPPSVARNQAVAMGYRINGLGVQTTEENMHYDLGRYSTPEEFLRQEVITPDGFAMGVESWDDFNRAIRAKIGTELAAR